MPKKKRSKPLKGQPTRGRTSTGFLVLAYLFAVVCIAAGVIVLAFGSGEPGADVVVATGDVPMVGWTLIVLGVLAAGLSAAIQCTSR